MRKYSVSISRRSVNRLLFGFFLLLPIIGQGQAWQWGRMGGTNIGNSTSRAVVTDVYGNVYISGNFYGGSIVFGTDTVYGGTPAIGDGTFLVKYGPMGNILWAKNLGNSSGDEMSMAVDVSGNVYLAGEFVTSTLILGGDTLLNDSGVSSSLYIAKVNGSGSVIWARRPIAPDTSVTWANSINVDDAGNVYLEGVFGGGWVVFGTDTLINPNPSIFTYNIFLAKYDGSGNAIWGRQGTMGTTAGGGNVATDKLGDVFMGGYYSGPTIVFGADTLTNSGRSVSFLVKYSPSGNELWAKGIKGGIYGLAADRSGNVIAGGAFLDTLIVGSDILISTDTTSGNAFVAKFGPLGIPIWARSATGTSEVNSVAVDDSGNTFITGNFDSTFSIGPYSLPDAGNADIFLAKYSDTGKAIWAIRNGGSGDEVPLCVTTDSSGTNIFIAGFCDSTVLIFGGDALDCSGNSYGHVFLAKLNSAGSLAVPSEFSESMVSVYPNPTHDNLAISTTKTVTNVTINDRVGTTIFNEGFNQGSVNVSVGSLPAGMYLVTVTDSDGAKTVRKIVKE